MKHHRPFSLKSNGAALASALGLMLLQSGAQAAIESGHWRVAGQVTDNSLAYNLTVQIDQNPEGNYTGTFFKYDAQTGTLNYVTRNADEGSTLFVTRPGQVINDNTLTSLANADRLSSSNHVAQVGTDFYLGAATELSTDPGFQYNDQHWTVFGWAHFKTDTQGNLQIVDSAMSFNEGGIVTGTLAVPEVSTWSLMALGLVGLSWVTRQQRRPQTS